MQPTRRILLTVLPALAIVACSVASVALPTATPPPPPTAAATETAQPVPTDTAVPPTATAESTTASGTQAAYDALGLSLYLFIPAGLANGTANSTTTSYEFPYINPSAGDMPEHIKVVLNGYAAQGSLFEPEILVFPAAAYAGYSDLTAQIVSTVRDVPYQDGQPLPEGLPGGQFHAQVGAVAFANGHGIRYLSQFSDAPLPINNRELIYYFHGLTSDNNTYVEAVLPVQAAFLPADENPNSPLPPGGVPFTMDDLGGYFQNIGDKLDATPPDAFTPSLATLDALLQSISIK